MMVSDWYCPDHDTEVEGLSLETVREDGPPKCPICEEEMRLKRTRHEVCWGCGLDYLETQGASEGLTTLMHINEKVKVCTACFDECMATGQFTF